MSDRSYTKVRQVGWHWFLPDEHCPTPTGFLRFDRPVVLLVGVEKVTRDMPAARFVVRFPHATMFVDDMSGDWEFIEEPQRMAQQAMKRVQAKTPPGFQLEVVFGDGELTLKRVQAKTPPGFQSDYSLASF